MTELNSTYMKDSTLRFESCYLLVKQQLWDISEVQKSSN